MELSNIQSALEIVRKFIPPTLLSHSQKFSSIVGTDVYLKWESRLYTGSFKERGVLNYLSKLKSEGTGTAVCAASAGNHALALSYYSKLLGVPCQIVMPTTAPLVKVKRTESYGAKVTLVGENFTEAYEAGKALSARSGQAFVSPYDHPWIVAGQGTCGMEILSQLPEVDCVIIPYGGGGLLSGVAASIKLQKPQVQIVGVRSELSTAPNSVSGQQPATRLAPISIADGISPKGPGEITRPLVEKFVDTVCTVSEEQIANAVISLLEHESSVVEGAAAVTLASLMNKQVASNSKKIVLVMTGSNIDFTLLYRLVEKSLAHRAQLLKINISVPDRPGALNAVTALLAREGANVLDVYHDRWFSAAPGNVDITFLMETRDSRHQGKILEALSSAGLTPQSFSTQVAGNAAVINSKIV